MGEQAVRRVGLPSQNGDGTPDGPVSGNTVLAVFGRRE